MNEYQDYANPAPISTVELKEIFNPNRKADKVFFYHNECIDGAGALWSAVNMYKDDMTYVPLLHLDDDVLLKQISEKIDENSEIIFADFAPSTVVMDGILEKMENGKGKVRVVDHHTSAIKDYKDYPPHPKLELVFDKDRSGAWMMYDEIHNNGVPSSYETLPEIIQDATNLDLNLVDSKDFKEKSSYIDSFELNTPHRAYLVAKMINSMNQDFMHRKGTLIYSQETEKINKLFESQASLVDIKIPETSDKPYKVVVVPARLKDYSRHFDNELIRYTKESGADLGMSYYIEEGLVKVSIRRPDETLDLSDIADEFKKQGKSGGGRPSAAAVRFTPAQFTKAFGFPPAGYVNYASRKSMSRFCLTSGALQTGIAEAKEKVANQNKFNVLAEKLSTPKADNKHVFAEVAIQTKKQAGF